MNLVNVLKCSHLIFMMKIRRLHSLQETLMLDLTTIMVIRSITDTLTYTFNYRQIIILLTRMAKYEFFMY